MEKLDILDDNALGLLLRVAFGFVKPQKGKISIITPLESLLSIHLALNLLHKKKPRLFGFKTTIGMRTVDALKNTALDLHRNASATIVLGGNSSGPTSFLNRSKKAQELADYIENNYDYNKYLKNKDLAQLAFYHSVLPTLVDQISVSKKQLPELKSFIQKYYDLYKQKLLVGQVDLYQPKAYAEPIFKAINSPVYIEKFGLERTPIYQESYTNFCHSLMHLYKQDRIELLNLKRIWINKKQYWKAEINNISARTVGPTAPEEVLEWNGLKLRPSTGRSVFGKLRHAFQTERAHFKILKLLLEKQGNIVTFEQFFAVLDGYMTSNPKVNKGFVSKKIRELRSYYNINTKVNPEDDIFHPTGTGWQLIPPESLQK